MSKEATTPAVESPSFLRELFRAELYKRNQGKLARQATFGAVAIAFALGAWSLQTYLLGSALPVGAQYGLSLAVLVGGSWLAFRLVNFPRFADFLIAVEVEMTKVTWPTRSELVRSSIVVIGLIFGLSAVLLVFDYVWAVLLRFVGVI